MIECCLLIISIEHTLIACTLYNNFKLDQMIPKTLIQIKQDVKHISAKRRQFDDLFSQFQSLVKSKINKLPISKVRIQFQQMVSKLRQIVMTHTEQLEQLRYRTERLKMEGKEVEATLMSLEALQEYFKELGKKVKDQQARGQQDIAERERWEVSQNQHQGFEEESQLIMSAGAARDVRQNAELVLGSLQNQGGRLQAARQKMGSVLKNINLSGNIVNLLKRRSKEDNRLIMWLTLGLVLEIFLCVYYIRPYFKGR